MSIVTCPKCGAKNRIDEKTAATRQPVCGKCGTKLTLFSSTPVSGKPIEVTDATLQRLLEDAGDRPVLVDCWATWCPPCRALAPTIDALANESAGRWIIAKLDTDQNQSTAARFKIDGIPTMLIFKKGQLVDRMEGVSAKEEIESHLSRATA